MRPLQKDLRNAHREQQASREPPRPPAPAPRPADTASRPAPEVYAAVGPVRRADSAPAKSPSTFTCSKCASERLEVAYGQYGYYFKCLTCDGNTRIDLKCKTCNGKLRTRKSQRQFFAECKTCDTSKLYFTNPS